MGKTFDTKARVVPKEAVEVKKISDRQAPDNSKAMKKADWRAQSEAFRSAIKDARVVDQFVKEGRPLSELPPPKATAPELDDRVQCPHCSRKFGYHQAERHIPICPK